MKQGQDISAKFQGIFIIHQKIRGKTVERHRHDEHEIFIPLQGEIQIETANGTIKAGPGKMLYLPPAVEHSFQSAASSQGERLIVIIEDRIWKSVGAGNFEAKSVSVSQLAKELLFHLLIYPKTKASKPLIETLIQTTSEMLEDSDAAISGDLAHLAGKASDPRIKTALTLIQGAFDQSLPMETIARKSGLSIRNLNRLFLEELGATPKQVVTLFRIKKAKRLLKERRLSVTDVALEVGYQSVAQFIGTFRRITGQLPSEF